MSIIRDNSMSKIEGNLQSLRIDRRKMGVSTCRRGTPCVFENEWTVKVGTIKGQQPIPQIVTATSTTSTPSTETRLPGSNSSSTATTKIRGRPLIPLCLRGTTGQPSGPYSPSRTERGWFLLLLLSK